MSFGYPPKTTPPAPVPATLAALQEKLDPRYSGEPALPARLSAASLNATYALKGETSGTLIYANGAYPPRPADAVAVTYIGPVQPTTWLPNDTWKDNS